MTDGMQDYSLDQAFAILGSIRDQVEETIVGKRDAIDQMLVAMLCGSHVLLEDVPGVGKTVMARALARATGCDFGRVPLTCKGKRRCVELPSPTNAFGMARVQREFRPTTKKLQSSLPR